MANGNNNNGIKIIAGVLAVLLVLAGAFAIKLYNQEKDTKSQLTKEKNVVLADLKEMVGKYDVVIEENNLKDTELNEARDRIEKLIADVDGKDATIASLSKYRAEVFKLRNERDFLFAQNDSLRGSNQMLAMRVDSTTYELEVQRGLGDSLSMENNKLSERVTLAAALSVNRLKAVGVIERSSGKLVENSNNKRIDKVRACYTVPQNRLAEVGDRELYVQVVDPNGNTLGSAQNVAFDGTMITYSTVSKFYYESKELDICENIGKNGGEFLEGTYEVNVYDKASLIAQTSFSLN